MKAIEVLVEYSGVNPKPAGIIGQGLKRVGAAALGALGAKNAAKAVSGSADIGARANKYNQEFTKFLQQQGKPVDDVEYADLNQFIDDMNLPKIKLPTDGWVAPGDLGDIFKDIAEISVGKSASGVGNTSNARIEPTGTAQTGQSTNRPASRTTAEPAAEPEKPVTPSSNPFSNPQQLLSAFQDYADADGKFTPELRRVVRSIWMQMGGTKAESKQHQKKGI